MAEMPKEVDVTMHVTVTFSYDADPSDYEEGAEPMEMAKHDETLLNEDFGALIEELHFAKDLVVKVKFGRPNFS